jgi:arginase family enzyme
MRMKNEHAKTPETWFGLNRPGEEPENVDAVIFGIPFDGGVSYRGGAAQAPDLLRANTDHATPCTERLDFFSDFRILDAGNFQGDDRDEMFSEVEAFGKDLVRQGKRFTMVAGDHSVTIPVRRGINAALN